MSILASILKNDVFLQDFIRNLNSISLFYFYKFFHFK